MEPAWTFGTTIALAVGCSLAVVVLVFFFGSRIEGKLWLGIWFCVSR